MNLIRNCCKLTNFKINNIYSDSYISRNITTIEDYKIKWTRPPRVPETRSEQSGDLGLNISVKSTDLPLYYGRSKELESANDIVKKIFTLEFQPAKETRNVRREKAIALVKRHVCDRGSSEAAIAAMTSEIQDLQEYIEKHPRNTPTKIFLKELIDRRNMYLKFVRRWDYKRFEWILERLNLIYKPQPVKQGMVSRKDSLRILTQQYCDNIIEKKLNDYKDELRAQQKEFFREKAEKLAFIAKEEKECGLKASITEEDIENARRKAEEL